MAYNYNYTSLNSYEANGINDAGQIVGSYDNYQQGFLYSGGTYTTLSVPGSTLITSTITFAYGINDAGQVVGSDIINDGNDQGFLYSGGTYTTVSVPGSFNTAAYGINDAGQIVGTYDG